MLAYFGGMIPACFTIAVIEEATQLLNAELPRNAVDHSGWNIRQIFQERTQKPGCAELDGKSQAGMVAAMRVNDPPVTVVEEKVSR
jgi:hypothetical protein